MTLTVDDTFLRQLCWQSAIPMVVFDKERRVVFCNRSAELLFERSADELMGRPFRDRVVASQRDRVDLFLKRTLDTDERHELDLACLSPGCATIDLVGTAVRITDENGAAMAGVLQLLDVRGRFETRSAHVQAHKMSALCTMAGAVAHHFNNLLGGLLTTLDFVRQSQNRATVQRGLGSMADTLSRAITITRALLAFAEGDRADDEVGDVRTIVEEFSERIRPTLAAQQIALELRLEEIHAQLPSRKLNTILECLTTNAGDAMPGGGRLEIELKAADSPDDFLLRISDTGSGITDGDLEHVFEPFFTTRRAESGQNTTHLGLGLAMVHGIVQDLGGTITLCSSYQSGTICAVRLPRSLI